MKSKKLNKLKFLGTAVLMSMTLMTAVPMITYAQANPEEETENTGEVITSEGIIIERIQDEAKHPDEKETAPYTKPTDDDYEGILTPEGNLTLVDDLDEAESEELEFYDDDEYESEVYEEDSDDSDPEDADMEYINLDEED